MGLNLAECLNTAGPFQKGESRVSDGTTFLLTEVWPPIQGIQSLSACHLQNRIVDKAEKPTVLVGYKHQQD